MSALTRKWVLVLRSSCHKELPLCRGETGRPRTVTQQDAHHGQIAHSHLIRNVVYEYSQEISCSLNSYLSGLFSHAGHNSIAKGYTSSRHHVYIQGRKKGKRTEIISCTLSFIGKSKRLPRNPNTL